ncbi:MAG: GlmU family protein [Luteibaculaceae bacterium]
MHTIILFDNLTYKQLLPFTYTRPTALLRWGGLTIQEKWQKAQAASVTVFTRNYLRKKYPTVCNTEVKLYVNASVLPWHGFAEALLNLNSNTALVDAKSNVLAFKSSESFTDLAALFNYVAQAPKEVYRSEIICLQHSWQLFAENAREIELDFKVLTKDKLSAPIPEGNTIIGNQIFLEPGAKITASVINTTSGPVYLSKDAEIMEGCLVRGGLFLGEGAQLKMGAKIYGASTFGPFCKVGGEVNNSILFGYSNKGHDGFLGNSVLGEWCNLGADTNNSNLKNNYSSIKVWSYETEMYADTGLQFCGLMMGDHSKSSINAMFNTGTVVGVAANVFGSGFPPKLVPSFSWGGSEGFETFLLPKAIEMAKKMCERRHIDFTEVDEEIFGHIFSMSQKFRK